MPKKGVVPPQLRPFLFKKKGGHKSTSRKGHKSHAVKSGARKMSKGVRHVAGRVVGNQTAGSIAKGAIGLTGVKFLLRLLGAPAVLGNFEQPVENITTGAILQFSGIGGGGDLLSAGVKEGVSEGIAWGANLLLGGTSPAMAGTGGDAL